MIEVNTNVNEDENIKSNEFESFKKHWAKHKKKYIIGGLTAVAFGLGFHFGNRGNSKRHYTKLLKDGVSDAVREGIKDVVDKGMRDIVKDGMEDVVTDVMTDVVDNTIGETVAEAVNKSVKRAIKDSAVTIIKEVKEEPKSLKPKHIEELQKILNNLTEDRTGLEIRYDSEGNMYIVKNDA